MGSVWGIKSKGGKKVEIIITRSPGITHYRKVESISPVKVEQETEIESLRKKVVNCMVNIIFPTGIMAYSALKYPEHAYANENPAESIRQGFTDILDIFTAIVEPILWFYALTACVLMATKNKDAGWQRLKQVGYAYAGIALLPTFFAFLRWVSDMLTSAIKF